MIIVNQDKTEIAVCDNGITVTDGIQQVKGLEIAKYATEERAKQVLQAIVSAYQASELYKVSDTNIQTFMIENYEKAKLEPFKYEMPAE